MPRPRFDNLDADKQATILNAALEAFAEHGFEDASYNHIIEQAGISKGAMYYYFDDKEDLYSTVVRRELGDLMEGFQALPEAQSVAEFWSALETFSNDAIVFFAEHPLKMRLIRTIWRIRADGLKSPLMQEIHEMGRGFTVQMVEMGQRVGAVRTDLPFEYLVNLVTSVDEVGDTWLIDHFEEISEKDFTFWTFVFVDILKRILAPAANAVAGSRQSSGATLTEPDTPPDAGGDPE